jgi:hypothetical protein
VYGAGSQDLGASDSVKDLTDSIKQPPNNVTFTVGGLVSGEDRVLVGPWNGSATDAEGNPAIQVDQLSVNGAITGTVTSVVVVETIPSDTPSAGVIRVQLASGAYKRVPYTSYTGSTFTIGSTDFSGDNAANGANVWVAYIDELASAASANFTSVYASNRNLVIKVRDGGASPIKEFITSGVLGSTGGSVTAIRTSDA